MLICISALEFPNVAYDITALYLPKVSKRNHKKNNERCR